MDEEDDRDFSKSIVFAFLEQAEQTLTKMDVALSVAPTTTTTTTIVRSSDRFDITGKREIYPSYPVWAIF